ncbi:MAG: type I secretion system permease/ATPase [Pseudomonadota bacterium]
MSPSENDQFDIFKGCRQAAIAVGVLSFFINVMMLAGPLFMLQVYDRVLASGSVSTLVGLTLIVGVTYLFYGVLSAIRSRILGRIGRLFDGNHSARIFGLAAHGQASGDERSSDPLSDFDRVRSFIGGAGLSALYDLPWIPVYLAILYLFSFWLGLTVTIGAAVLLALMLASTHFSRPRLSALNEMANERNLLLRETQANAQVITGMGMAAALTKKWQTLNNRYMAANEQVQDTNSLFSSATQTFRMALQSAILAMGAYLVIYQEITAGVMIAASILSARAVAPLEQAINHWNAMINARLSLQRLIEATGAVKTDTVQLQLPNPKQRFSAIQVAIGAPASRTPILRDVNFSLRAGDALAVLGPSGSGKSTLARALAGVWPTLSGAVRADGVEIDQWSEQRRGSFTGYLPQNIQLFDGTIAENIARFDDRAKPDEVIEAAKRANAHDLILSFSDGYDTLVGMGGRALSGGELQRIGLARAFFRNPFIIVLDEPNSNLDSNGENALEEAIKGVQKRGGVVVMVTHRTRLINVATNVLLIDQGRQIAYGPSQTVMSKMAATPSSQMPTNAPTARGPSHAAA